MADPSFRELRAAAEAAYARDDHDAALALCERMMPLVVTAQERSSAHAMRARALYSQRRFLEAGAEREEEIMARLESAGDPVLIETVRYAAAWAYSLGGAHDRALQLASQNYLNRERLIGAEDPRTLRSLQLCASSLAGLGRAGELIPVARELHEQRVRVLGADASETRDSAKLLAEAEAGLASSPTAPSSPGAAGAARTDSAASAPDATRAARAAPDPTHGMASSIVEGTTRGTARGIIEGLLP